MVHMPKRERKLKEMVENLLWMAARYADGRNTYAPHIIRDVVDDMKDMYKGWKPKTDITIQKPEVLKIKGIALRGDYLWDIFNPDKLR